MIFRIPVFPVYIKWTIYERTAFDYIQGYTNEDIVIYAFLLFLLSL